MFSYKSYFTFVLDRHECDMIAVLAYTPCPWVAKRILFTSKIQFKTRNDVKAVFSSIKNSKIFFLQRISFKTN